MPNKITRNSSKTGFGQLQKHPRNGLLDGFAHFSHIFRRGTCSTDVARKGARSRRGRQIDSILRLTPLALLIRADLLTRQRARVMALTIQLGIIYSVHIDIDIDIDMYTVA